jgi:threonyl-tRNA synthetase
MPDENEQPKERKSLDDRAKMTELERIRHSAAHVLATAILRLWPDAQFAAGPPVENGFYYDVDLPHRISPEDFPRIEEEMKKEIKANNVFEKVVVSREQALKDAESGRLAAVADRKVPSRFKLDIVQNIPEGEPISYYRNGDFIDLCAGPHVMRTGNIGAFKLTHVASAYYKGDERNPQLQRIYGTAFKNKTEMEAWFTMLEEAKKRDHRKIGTEMGLFAIDTEFVGPGLPLWLPKGTAILEELEKLAKETEFAAGYVRVKTPHIGKKQMYERSGHLPYYAQSMFPPMHAYADAGANSLWHKIDETKEGHLKLWKDKFEPLIDSLIRKPRNRPPVIDELLAEFLTQIPAENRAMFVTMAGESFFQEVIRAVDGPHETYYLKAMNCPHHHRIFAAQPRSYRDLPLRLAEYGTCYRYEQSGELFGLMRVRSLNMNDAHIYCTEDQFAAEFNAVNEMYLKYFKIFGIEKYVMRFSTHDPSRLTGDNAKFVNEPELWKKTEDLVRRTLIESKINYVEVPNEAAFYGPKIDVQVWSVIGREFTLATNQVDFAVPKRFGLTYRDRDNTEKTPLCIHRAPLGTHERFIGFLIEHYAGNFPLWLAPEQVRVLTLNDDEKLVAYAKEIHRELRAHEVRAEADFSPDPIKAKIAEAEKAKVHTMLVIGGRDMDASAVSVRLHSKGPQGAKPKGEVVAEILAKIRNRAD